jgi:predicted 2-oxoglutarate/Fe(II)-dependent dioxygenase YbiX
MLQLGRRATLRTLGGDERAALRAHFDRHMWARLPGVFDAPLLMEVQEMLRHATFEAHVHDNVSPPSIDWIMAPGPATALLEMLLNDPLVYRDVEAITGCAPISHFVALLYRMIPEQGHQHQWHNDLIDNRMIAISVTLGPEAYEGGVLELREQPSGRVLGSAPNPAPGDAVIFAIDPGLQHRVTRVTSGVKTAFAGWFCGGPRTYFDVLRSAIS